MPFYIAILALFFLYGCSGRTIVIEKDKETVDKKIVDAKTVYEEIILEREPFTPVEFRQLMKELDNKLFIDLDSKLFKGKDWVEHKNVKQTLKSLMAQTRKLKEFDIIKNDEEATKLLKKLITHEYMLDEVVKSEKFDYIKPAFDRVIESCNRCHDSMI